MASKNRIDLEIIKVDSDDIMKCLDWVYDLAVEGVEDSPFLKPAKDIGNHYKAGVGSLNERARRLVRWQVTKAGTTGFLSGLGGVIAMPVTIPANIASVMYVQIRMIAAIAHLGGYDVRNDQVRTLCYACLCGTSAAHVVKDTGIKLGTKLTEEAIKRLSGEVLTAINKKVGFRLVTKFGQKGVINLGKMVPITGGSWAEPSTPRVPTPLGRSPERSSSERHDETFPSARILTYREPLADAPAAWHGGDTVRRLITPSGGLVLDPFRRIGHDWACTKERCREVHGGTMATRSQIYLVSCVAKKKAIPIAANISPVQPVGAQARCPRRVLASRCPRGWSMSTCAKGSSSWSRRSGGRRRRSKRRPCSTLMKRRRSMA